MNRFKKLLSASLMAVGMISAGLQAPAFNLTPNMLDLCLAPQAKFVQKQDNRVAFHADVDHDVPAQIQSFLELVSGQDNNIQIHHPRGLKALTDQLAANEFNPLNCFVIDDDQDVIVNVNNIATNNSKINYVIGRVEESYKGKNALSRIFDAKPSQFPKIQDIDLIGDRLADIHRVVKTNDATEQDRYNAFLDLFSSQAQGQGRQPLSEDQVNAIADVIIAVFPNTKGIFEQAKKNRSAQVDPVIVKIIEVIKDMGEFKLNTAVLAQDANHLDYVDQENTNLEVAVYDALYGAQKQQKQPAFVTESFFNKGKYGCPF